MASRAGTDERIDDGVALTQVALTSVRTTVLRTIR